MKRKPLQRCAWSTIATFVVGGPIVVIGHMAADRVPSTTVLWIVFAATLATTASVVFLELADRPDNP